MTCSLFGFFFLLGLKGGIVAKEVIWVQDDGWVDRWERKGKGEATIIISFFLFWLSQKLLSWAGLGLAGHSSSSYQRAAFRYDIRDGLFSF